MLTRGYRSSHSHAKPRGPIDVDEVADQLLGELELTVAPGGRVYASRRDRLPHIALLIGSDEIHALLQDMVRARTGQHLRDFQLRDLENLLRARAQDSGVRAGVWVRVGRSGGGLYLDLGGATGEVVVVTAEGWKVEASAPLKFWRPAALLPMPLPARAGDCGCVISSLFPHFGERDHRTIAAFMLGCLVPGLPQPILEIVGPPGSAKTALAQFIGQVVDPSVAAAAGLPENVRDLVIAARNGWLLSFDNVNSVPNAHADALCRISSGGAHRVRKLYTDDGEHVIQVQRPVMFTATQPVLVRADLRDRSLLVSCPPIPESERRPMELVMKAIADFAPSVLGWLLDGLACALRRMGSIRPDRLPRLADFATWAMAASPVLGFAESTFLADLQGQQEEGHADALEGCPLTQALRTFMLGRERWEGTAAGLYTQLMGVIGERGSRDRTWPSDPAAFSRRLNQVAFHLHALGLRVTRTRGRGGRQVGRPRLISIEWTDAGGQPR